MIVSCVNKFAMWGRNDIKVHKFSYIAHFELLSSQFSIFKLKLHKKDLLRARLGTNLVADHITIAKIEI